MYLHLGNDRIVRMKDVIGIFDMDTSTVSRYTRDYLTGMEKAGRVVNVAIEQLPKSFVLCSQGGEERLYISPISSTTLLKRTAYIDGISNV